MIAPAEVEQALLKHVAVSEAAAFPIPHPTLGEDLGVAVVLRASAETPSEPQLHAFLAKRLAPIKLPRQIIAVDAIPKGSTGKTERGRLSEELGLTSGRTDPPSAAAVYANSAIETALAGLWANVLHLDMVGPEDDFLHLGGDSLQAMRLTNLVNEVFGIELEWVFIISENRTVRAMARAIVEARHKKNA